MKARLKLRFESNDPAVGITCDYGPFDEVRITDKVVGFRDKLSPRNEEYRSEEVIAHLAPSGKWYVSTTRQDYDRVQVAGLQVG